MNVLLECSSRKLGKKQQQQNLRCFGFPLLYVKTTKLRGPLKYLALVLEIYYISKMFETSTVAAANYGERVYNNILHQEKKQPYPAQFRRQNKHTSKKKTPKTTNINKQTNKQHNSLIPCESKIGRWNITTSTLTKNNNNKNSTKTGASLIFFLMLRQLNSEFSQICHVPKGMERRLLPR